MTGVTVNGLTSNYIAINVGDIFGRSRSTLIIPVNQIMLSLYYIALIYVNLILQGGKY